MTLLIDSMGELTEALGRIEDWLLWADPDCGDETELVERGAQAAGTLGMAVRAALADAPRLLAPDRTQLALLVALPSDSFREGLGAVAAATAALRRDPNRPAGAVAVLTLLTDCVAQDGTDDVCQLAAVMTAGGSAGRWLGLEGGNENGDGATRRWTTRLDDDEFAAYRRFAATVLSDPLDRFAASGL